MDVRIAKAFRNSPHQNEVRYLFLLPDIREEEKLKKVIRRHLPSITVLCNDLTRFMCVGAVSDQHMARVLRKHPVAALLTHSKLVLGFTVLLRYTTNETLVECRKFLDRALVDILVLRELIPAALPSPACSLHSLESSSTPGTPKSTTGLVNKNMRQTQERRVCRKLQYGDSPRSTSLLSLEDDVVVDEVEPVSWESLSEKFKSGINDEERQKRVTMEDYDLSMISFNSQDLDYQRELYQDFVQLKGSVWIDEDDAVAYGSPGIRPGEIRMAYDLSSPLPTDDFASPRPDTERQFCRIVEVPDKTQPFPTGDELRAITRQEFYKDATSRQEHVWAPHEVPQSSPKPERRKYNSDFIVECISPIPFYRSTVKQEEVVPIAGPSSPDSHSHAMFTIYVDEDQVQPPRPKERSIFNIRVPLGDITEDFQPKPKEPKPAPAQNIMKNLHYETSRLQQKVSVLKGRISNQFWGRKLEWSSQLKNKLNFKVPKLDNSRENYDIGRGHPSLADQPILPDASGIFVPIPTPDEDRAEGSSFTEWRETNEDLFNSLDKSELEESWTSNKSGDFSWETIDDDDETWHVPLPPVGHRLIPEDVVDPGWFYFPWTGGIKWEEPTVQDGECMFSKREKPAFPPRFRFERPTLVSCALVQIYPDWHIRRHPSETPFPEPEPVGLFPEVILRRADEAPTAPTIQTNTGSTISRVRGPDSVTGGSVTIGSVTSELLSSRTPLIPEIHEGSHQPQGDPEVAGVTGQVEGAGASVIPAPENEVLGPEFVFRVPDIPQRPRRVRRVQPVYTEESESDEPPRRKRRTRRRRRQVPPPADEELVAPPPPEPLAQELHVQPDEEERTPSRIWDVRKVKAELKRKLQESGSNVLKFTDFCESGVCPRNSASSFFSFLLVLETQGIITLDQTDQSGKPEGLLIMVSDRIFE